MIAQTKTVKQVVSLPGLRIVLLIGGFLLALLLRLVIGGVGVAHSPFAGLAFAVVLISLSIVSGVIVHIDKQVIAIGIFGAALLCLPVALKNSGLSYASPSGNYPSWAIVVSIVALAEEMFLRGALFQLLERWKGQYVAVVVAAILFTILHIPLYGWHVVPLDLAVGLWFGALRVVAKSWIAPGIAHTFADLAGWWFV